jgi:hypothetical protein
MGVQLTAHVLVLKNFFVSLEKRADIKISLLSLFGSRASKDGRSRNINLLKAASNCSEILSCISFFL